MIDRDRRSEPIEDYLDELLVCLRLPARATRRLLNETEEHLREAAAEAEGAGASPIAAERQAVERFGSAAQIAAAASAARRPTSAAAVGVVVWSGVLLSGIGLVAVGVSGILAAVFNLLAGRRFVGALPGKYGATSCHHFLALRPGAPTCSAAAILENSDDAVALRVLAGALGLLLLALAWWARRYLTSDPSFRRALRSAVAATAALAFGLAATLLLGTSAATAIHHGSDGVGWSLSGGLVSLGASVIAATLCWRDARTIRPWRHVRVAA